MAFIGEAPRGVDLQFQALLEMDRPHKQEVVLEVGGTALHIDPIVLCLLKNKIKRNLQLGITRDVTIPTILVKEDGSIRNYASEGQVPLFDTLPLGLRPSRPFIVMDKGRLKATFQRDGSNSLTLVLESAEEIKPVNLPIGVDPRKYLKDLYEPATEEDLEARITEQEQRYFGYLEASIHGGPRLTRQWIEWGRNHDFKTQPPQAE